MLYVHPKNEWRARQAVSKDRVVAIVSMFDRLHDRIH